MYKIYRKGINNSKLADIDYIELDASDVAIANSNHSLISFDIMQEINKETQNKEYDVLHIYNIGKYRNTIMKILNCKWFIDRDEKNHLSQERIFRRCKNIDDEIAKINKNIESKSKKRRCYDTTKMKHEKLSLYRYQKYVYLKPEKDRSNKKVLVLR